MTSSDYIIISLTNIRKNRLRSLLTIVGVAVAIGALTSMLSLGIGLQKNINTALNENRLITRITVSSGNDSTAKINDSTIAIISQMVGVEKTFIENRMPVKILVNGKNNNCIIKTVPFSFAGYFPENMYLQGGFFTSDTQNSLIITDMFLKNLLVKTDTTLSHNKLKLDSLINTYTGRPVEVSALTFDTKVLENMFSMLSAVMAKKLPFRDSVLTFTICGIVKQSKMSDWETGAYITETVAKKIPGLEFENIWDLMDRQGHAPVKMLSVFTAGINETAEVQQELKQMGFNATSILDNMQELKRMFIIMDSILGAIGIMALFIATLGLANTLVMAIYERTREIGILKSLGARNSAIRNLFMVEAGSIGCIGAIVGIPLGWGVTRIIDGIFFSTVFKYEAEKIVLFAFPWYLIAGVFVFAVLFSVLAGLYPAMRAARIDPVKALWHE